MACTCTEDKEVIGNVTIGRNRVMCQECIDRNAADEKKRQVQEKSAQIREIELSNLRKLYDGEDMKEINAQRSALRAEIQKLIKG